MNHRLKYWWITQRPEWLNFSNYELWFFLQPKWFLKDIYRNIVNWYFKHKNPEAFARLEIWRTIRGYRQLQETMGSSTIIFSKNLYEKHPILERLLRKQSDNAAEELKKSLTQDMCSKTMGLGRLKQ
jgi:hypothetical protein